MGSHPNSLCHAQCRFDVREGGGGWGFKLLTLKMWQFQTNFSPLLLELKNHYKHVLNSPRYISGFQTLSPCRSWQGIIIVRSQSFSRFRVIITLFEMINEPRLKIEPYAACFLFIQSSISTSKKSSLSDGHFTINKCWFQDSDFGFYMVYTVVLNASYEIKSCLLLNDFMFSCYFNVIFLPRVNVNRRVWGSKFLTSNRR